MVWGVFQKPRREAIIEVPRTFNDATMYRFIGSVLDGQHEATATRINFDFSILNFIEPVGVVVLSNLIEYLRKNGVEVRFVHHNTNTSANKYLDDAGFFQHYLRKSVFPGCQLRGTTIPLKIIDSNEFTSYLYTKLMPWIAMEVGLTDTSLAALRTSLEEILHNVNDHSGVGAGCAFAQHFPRSNQIQIAISDFGHGIPNVVRTVAPELSDPEALRQACEEGFTTKSNVRNRGAGLPNLMRYVTQRNNGTVLIASGKGNVSAVKGGLEAAPSTRITARHANGVYPGTLVRVILRTDTLERVAADAELEPFEW